MRFNLINFESEGIILQMNKTKHQKVWIELSKNAIVENFNTMKELKGATAPFVNVTANALGFGLSSFVRGLIAANVSGFTVNSLSEAIFLRRLGTNKDILVFEPASAENAFEMADEFITATVDSLKELKKIASKLHSKFPLNVFLSRNMFNKKEAKSICLQHPNQFDLKGFYYLNQKSDDNFGGKYFSIKTKKEDYIFGTSIYGMTNQPSLKSVLRLCTKIVQINSAKIIIPIGFKDGLSSSFKGFSFPLNGKKVEILDIDLNFSTISNPGLPESTHQIPIFDLNDENNIIKASEFIRIYPWELSTRLNSSIPRQLIYN